MGDNGGAGNQTQIACVSAWSRIQASGQVICNESLFNNSECIYQWWATCDLWAIFLCDPPGPQRKKIWMNVMCTLLAVVKMLPPPGIYHYQGMQNGNSVSLCQLYDICGGGCHFDMHGWWINSGFSGIVHHDLRKSSLPCVYHATTYATHDTWNCLVGVAMKW